jgi:hypothetical protein
MSPPERRGNLYAHYEGARQVITLRSVSDSKVQRSKVQASGCWFLAAAEGCPTFRFASVILPLISVFC